MPPLDWTAGALEGQGRMTEEARLGRIETKLDRLADAVVALARMEERMVTLFKRTDSTDESLREIEARLSSLERLDVGRGALFRILDKFAWLVIGAAVAMLAKATGLG